MFLTAVRHEVNNLESSVVVQELELAINLALVSSLLSLTSCDDKVPVHHVCDNLVPIFHMCEYLVPRINTCDF